MSRSSRSPVSTKCFCPIPQHCNKAAPTTIKRLFIRRNRPSPFQLSPRMLPGHQVLHERPTEVTSLAARTEWGMPAIRTFLPLHCRESIDVGERGQLLLARSFNARVLDACGRRRSSPRAHGRLRRWLRGSECQIRMSSRRCVPNALRRRGRGSRSRRTGGASAHASRKMRRRTDSSMR